MIDQLDIYCDGSVLPKHRFVGWAYAIYLGEELLDHDKGRYRGSRASSLDAELMGLTMGLEAAKKHKAALAIVHTDSHEVYRTLPKINGLTTTIPRCVLAHPLYEKIVGLLAGTECFGDLLVAKGLDQKHLFVHKQSRLAARVPHRGNTAWSVD